MAVLLSGTTIGGSAAIHAGNMADHGIITTSNIGSYALTSVPATISPTNIYVGNAIYFGGGNNYFNWDGARINSNVAIQSTSDMRAPIFYDSNDTNFYLNPNGLSRLHHIQVVSDWSNGTPNDGAINIRGAYPSMTFRNTISGNMWLRHMDGSGDIQHYFAPSGVDANDWGIKHTMFTNGNFYSSGTHTASQFNGSGAGLTGTASSLNVGSLGGYSLDTMKKYIWSRGENLLTNGTGLMGNNTNFSSFTFDGSEAYFSSGSFRYTGQFQAPNTDELMPVNPEKRYRLDFWARTANGQGAYYAYLNFFDVDGLTITAVNHMYYANTLTTLAQTLNPGDTVVYLTNAANWENGGTAGVSTHIRSFIFWNYVNSFGYLYPPETYSQNWYGGRWDPGAVNYSNNTITLISPWDGPSIAAGTKLSNGSAGGTFKYIALGFTIVPTTWTNYVGIMDGVDYSGTNAGGKFPPGTASAKLGFLTDYNASNDTIYLANLFVGVDTDYPIYDKTIGNTKIEKSGAFYGTIFYDSNNTSYYLDPNSTSNLYRVDAASQMRAPIFYDSQDTNYYLDPNSTSRLVTVNADTLRSYGNVYTDGNYGNGLVGLYSAERYQGVFAMGDSYKLAANGTTTGNLYGIAWTHTNVGGQSKSGLGHQALFMDNGVTQTAIGSGIWTNGLITTTSYGTSANWNTAFGWGNHAGAGYQPASTAITTSNIGSQSVSYADESGYSGSTGSVEWANVQNKPSTFPPSAHNHDDRYYTETESDGRYLRSDIYNSNYGGLQVFRNIGTIDGSWPDASHTFGLENNDAGNIVVNFHRAGYTSHNLWYNGSQFRFDQVVTSTADMRAPIFYDSQDTGYYVDPNGTSNLSRVLIPNASSGASLIVGINNTSRVYNDDARKGLVVNADYYPHIYVNALSSASNDVHGAVISMTGVLSAGGYRRWGMGIANTDPSALSWGWWDNESNPHYSVGGTLGYTSTGARMWLNTDGVLQTTGSMRAPIFYDSDDTAYYGDFASTSRFSRLLVQQSGVNSTEGPALRVSKGWDNGTPNIVYDTVVIESNDVTTIRMKEADGGTAGWSTGDGNTSFTSNVPMRFYTGGSENAYIYSGQGGTLAMYINNSQIVGIGTSDFSYTANDNSRTVGSTTNNRLFVNGSIQLLGNNDAIVIGRGTATFLSDEELGFGWGGGWYMTEESYMRSRGNKSLHMNGGSVDYVGSLYLEGSVGVHLQPNAGSYGSLQVTGSKDGWHGIRFTGSNVVVMANGSEVGFHNNNAGWQFRWYLGEMYISAGSSGGGTERTVIHSGNIGSQSVNYATSAGSASSSPYLSALGDYVFSASTNGRDFARGIQTSFVQAPQGYPDYGSVVRIRTYTGANDGGTAELYFPYSSQYGGTSMQYRLGQYSNAGWTGWKTVIDSDNIGSQSVASATSASYADSIYFNGVQKLYGGSDGTRNTGWAYHTNNGTGLHWPNNGWHIYPVNASDMYIRSGASDCSLKFTKLGESGSYVHCSADDNIGFLTTGRSWSLRVDNSGNAFATSSFRAPIFYDSDDTGYYLDPNGTSNLLQLNTATRARWNMPRTWYDRSSRTSDQGYWTGTNGWGAEDGTWAGAWKGGFSGWDIWGTGTDHPQGGGYVHAQGIVSGQHYATSSVGYGWMMVGAHNATENRYWLRGKWDTSTSGWVEMITTGNIASQSVNYADESGYSASSGSVEWANVQNKPTALSQFTNDLGNYGGWLTTSGKAADSELLDGINSSSFVRNDTTGQYLRAYYQYGSYLTTERPIDLRNQMGGSGMRVDFMNSGGGGNWNHVITFSGYDAYNMYQLGGYYDGGSTTNLYVRSEANHGTTSWTAWRRLLNEVADPYAVNMNQYVRTIDSPTFTNIYNNAWFRNNNVNEGLYNQATGTHFYSNSAEGFVVTGSGGVVQLQFRSNHQSTLRGYVYADTSNNIGFLNNGGSWSLRCDSSGNVTATGDVTAYSDARLKTNVSTIEAALEKVLQMRGVTYVRTDNNDTAEKVGVIAQEIQKVLPQVVNENTDGYLTVSYGNIVGVLIEAIKEQQKQIEELKSIINGLTR